MRKVSIDPKTNAIIFDGNVTKIEWSDMAMVSIALFHDLDPAKEIAEMIITMLDQQFSLTEEEKENAFETLYPLLN